MKEMFCEEFGIEKDKLRSLIQISSVDSFQGTEKDIIILHALPNQKRLNIAITRPKHFLFILGDEDTLTDMSDLIEFHKERVGSYYKQEFLRMFEKKKKQPYMLCDRRGDRDKCLPLEESEL